MADLLSIGKSGLFSSQKSLETSGHNIANANTDGYSRQRAQQTTNSPTIKDGIVQGTGSKITRVERYHDPYLEKRLNENISTNNFFDERAKQLEHIENIFAEIGGEGLNTLLNKFYNAFRQLANQPENETIRSVVRDTAAMVVNDFHRISETLEGLSTTIEQKVTANVLDINQLSRQVADFNRKIAAIEAAGDQTGDLRDARDKAIRSLSEYFDINTYLDDKNNFHVSAKGVGTLVSGGEFQEISAKATAKDVSTNNVSGAVEIFFTNRPNQPITTKFSAGIFTAAVQVRNHDIVSVKEKIDSIAFELANTVNAVHSRGWVGRRVEPLADGSIPRYDDRGPTTGVNFFKKPVEREGAALALQLSDEVRNDLSNIVTAIEANKAGDNRIAIGISKLQHEKILDNGSSTLEENYLKLIGNIGLEAGKARVDAEQSEGILNQTKSIKERISGVSIDEETANMVRFQNAYEASARVMRTADDMFKTVIGIMR